MILRTEKSSYLKVTYLFLLSPDSVPGYESGVGVCNLFGVLRGSKADIVAVAVGSETMWRWTGSCLFEFVLELEMVRKT